MRSFVLLLLLYLSSYRSGAQKQVPATSDSLPQSHISIPIQVALRPFYALAEKKVDPVFTSPNYPHDWVQPDCATRYKYRFRRSPLMISASGTSLHLGFTGYYGIIGSSRACVNGTVLSPWTPECSCGFKEGERKVAIGFGATFSLYPNYILKTKVVREEPKMLDKCTVCFWGQDITATVLGGLKKELDASKKIMEDSFGTIDLRPYMQLAWNKLSGVYPIPGAGYFSLNPKQLRMQNIGIKNDLLHINLGISATPAISLLTPKAGITPVPNLAGAKNEGGFNIHLEAALQYDSLSTLLNTYLMHKRIDVSDGLFKNHIIIEDAKVSADTLGHMVFGLRFAGSFTGTVNFIGKPVYNHETKSIEVEDMAYDLQTRSLLLKTAKWLFNKRITSELKKYASFPMASYYDSAAHTMNAWLNREWTKGIKGAGAISELKLTSVQALPGHLLIRTNCVGKLAVQVTEINLAF